MHSLFLSRLLPSFPLSLCPSLCLGARRRLARRLPLPLLSVSLRLPRPPLRLFLSLLPPRVPLPPGRRALEGGCGVFRLGLSPFCPSRRPRYPCLSASPSFLAPLSLHIQTTPADARGSQVTRLTQRFLEKKQKCGDAVAFPPAARALLVRNASLLVHSPPPLCLLFPLLWQPPSSLLPSLLRLRLHA